MIHSLIRRCAGVPLIAIVALGCAASCQAGVMRAATEVRVSAYVVGGCGSDGCQRHDLSHPATAAATSEPARSITEDADAITITY